MAAEMRLSVLLELKAQAARAEAAAFKSEAEALGRAVRSAGKEAAAGAGDIGKVGDEAREAATAVAAAAQAMLQTSAAQDELAGSAAQLIARIEATNATFEGNSRAILANSAAIQTAVGRQNLLAQSTGMTIAEQVHFRQELDAVRAQFDPLFAASRRYEQELRDIADAERMGALSATGAAAARDRAAQSLTPLASGLKTVGQNAQATTGHVTQLGYQFNDIGMMLAAGQNPLMLALQQGTQVNQVFDDMRDRGMSVGAALKQSFLNLLNPMNLVTMGAIALGAVAVQSLMSLGGEVKSVDDAFGDLKTSVSAFAQEAGRSVDDVIRDFGRLDAQVVKLQENLTAVATAKARRDLAESLQSLGATTRPSGFSMPAASAAELMGYSQDGFASAVDPKVEAFVSGIRSLENATGVQGQLDATRSLSAQLIAASGSIGQMTDAQFTFYQMLLETESAINRVAEAEAAAARQRVEMARETGTENARMGGPSSFDKADPTAALEANVRAAQARQSAAAAIAAAEQENDLARARLTYGEQSYELRALEANQAREATEAEIRRLGIAMQGVEASRMRAATEDAIALAEQSRQAASSAAAAKMRGDLEAEARIIQLTAQYGAQSLEVAYARAAAERDVYAATLAAQDISGAAADELMRAWDAARGIAAVNMAAGIGAAASEAVFLAAQLGISLDHAVALEGLKNGRGRGATPRSQPLSFGGAADLGDGITGGKALGFGDLSRATSYNTPSSGSSGADSGGGRGAKAAATSVADLIAKYEAENDILRTLDPIQKIVAQNHLALADATEEQRDKLVEVIAQNQRLTEVQERVQQIGQIGKNAFTGLATGALSFRSALGNVLDGLAQMAASSAWDLLWSGGGKKSGGGLGGLLSSFFGGGGGAPGAKTKAGGGLGSVLTSIIGRADGGPITGQGGPREDNILIRASSGEYMVNAAATAANLPLVEAINAGAGPRQLAAILGAMVSQPSLPAFADGGRIGGSAPSGWMRAASVSQATAAPAATGGEMAVTVNVEGARGNAEIAEMVERGVRSGIEAFSRSGLPARMRQINADPRRMS